MGKILYTTNDSFYLFIQYQYNPFDCHYNPKQSIPKLIPNRPPCSLSFFMYTLIDVQQNLKTLLKQLSQIQQTVSEPYNRKKYNEQNILLKIPKGVLLISICKYLTMQEINYLSSVSSGLRQAIYCPLGWKVLMRVKMVYPVVLKSQVSDVGLKIKNSLQPQTDINQLQSQSSIYKQRTKYKTILLSQYTTYLQCKQKNAAYLQNLKSQSSTLFRLKLQSHYLASISDSLHSQNKTNKQQLKKLSEGFDQRIREMDELNDMLGKQRTKLQNQKEALAGKVREYQTEIQNIKEDSEKSKEILKRLRNYLVYKKL